MDARYNTAHIKGLVFIFITACIWIGSSFVSQALVRPEPGQAPALPPFLLCYVCTSLFIVYLPIISLKRRFSKQSISRQAANEATRWLAHASHDEHEPLRRMESHSTDDAPSAAEAAAPPTSARQLAAAAAQVAPVWFLAQLAFALSLAHTSVTSNTILSSSSSLFTYLMSVAVLGERFTLAKITSVALVMAGTAAVTASDSRGGGDLDASSLLGDLLCVAAAALYAVYTIAMRRLLREDDADAMMLFFGYIGALTTVALAPAVAAAHWLGFLDLRLVSGQALVLALVNGLMDYCVSDYLWARAVLLVGPTVATLGLSVQIPLATALDLFLGDPQWVRRGASIALTAGGTLAIVAGFTGINLTSPDQAGPPPARDGGAATHEPGGDEEERRRLRGGPGQAPGAQHEGAL